MKEDLKFAMDILELNAREQNAFFKTLENTGLFTKKEVESIQIVVSYFDLLKNEKKGKAIKTAMAYAMYEQFNS